MDQKQPPTDRLGLRFFVNVLERPDVFGAYLKIYSRLYTETQQKWGRCRTNSVGRGGTTRCHLWSAFRLAACSNSDATDSVVTVALVAVADLVLLAQFLWAICG